jgi:hypothetical protein
MNTAARIARRRPALTLTAVTAAGAVAALGLSAGLAQAKAAPKAGGVVHIYEASTSTGNTGHDVFIGAISDYGTDTQGTGNSTSDKVVLKKGTFELNLAKLQAKIHPVAQDAADCSLVLGGSAPITLSHGTGAYKGISGSITVSFTDAVVFKLTKAGKCSPSPTAPELSSVSSVAGSGKVSF